MYGLKKIILIDSLFKGKVTPITIDKHACNTGTNGAGKTSIGKLIPFFYGLEPAHLENKAAGKMSFKEWYFPRKSSLIIFEYGRESGTACSVAYRHPNGEKIAYRLIHSGFDEEVFSKLDHKGKRHYCTSDDLVQNWKEKNIEHSKQIEIVMDYRAIIQGDRKLINRSISSRSDLRSLANRYSLGSSETSMQHMEKVVSAILGRHGSMEKIKVMLSSIMEEEGVVMPTAPSHKDNSKIIDNVGVIKSLKKHEGDFRGVLNHYANYLELGEKEKSFKLSLEQVGESENNKKESIDNYLNTLSISKKDENDRYEETRNDHSTTRIDAKNEYDNASDKLFSLEKKYDNYISNDIPEKENKFQNLPYYESEKNKAIQRCVDLTAAMEDVRRIFDGKEKYAGSHYIDNKKKLDDNLNEILINLTNVQQEKDHKLNKLGLEYAETKSDHLYLYNQKLLQVESKKAVLESNAKTLGATDDEMSRRAQIEYVIHLNDEKIEESELQYDASRCKVEEIKQQRNSITDVRIKAQRYFDKAQKELDLIQKILYPDNGTLLSYLRQSGLPWVHTIGKTINPDLLTRKNLNPSICNDEDAFYGLSLNLESIVDDVHSESEEQLSQRYQAQEQQLNVAKETLAEKTTDLQEVNEQTKVVESECSECLRILQNLKTEQKTNKQSLKTIKNEIENAIHERREKAKNEVSFTMQKIHSLNQQHENELKELENGYLEAKSDIDGVFSMEISNIENERSIAQNMVEQCTKNYKKEIKDIKSDFKSACSEKGVDHKVLNKAESLRDESEDIYETISNYQNIVRQYRDFLDNDWIRKEQIIENRKLAKAQFDKIKNDIQCLESDHKDKIKEINADINQARKDQKKIFENLDLVSSIISRFHVLDISGAASLNLPFETLLEQASALLERKCQLEEDIRSGVGRVDSLINRHGNSKLAEQWEARLTHLANDIGHDRLSEEFKINAPQALGNFLDQDFPDVENTTYEQLKTIGSHLSNFYSGLDDIKKQIELQARRVSDSISTTQSRITALQDISISMKSKIEVLDYWSVLTEFNEAWLQWREMDRDGIPDDDLIIHISDSLAALKVARVDKDIKSLFDFNIHLTENGRPAVIRNDTDLAESSSTGLSYLALCAIFIGISRLLCKDKDTALHWAVDELGTLASKNIVILFDMLNEANIIMVGGFPNSDPDILKNFTYKHHIDREKGVRVMNVETVDFAALAHKKKIKNKVEGQHG